MHAGILQVALELVAVHVQEGGLYDLTPSAISEHEAQLLAAVRATGFKGAFECIRLEHILAPGKAAAGAGVEAASEGSSADASGSQAVLSSSAVSEAESGAQGHELAALRQLLDVSGHFHGTCSPCGVQITHSVRASQTNVTVQSLSDPRPIMPSHLLELWRLCAGHASSRSNALHPITFHNSHVRHGFHNTASNSLSLDCHPLHCRVCMT